MLDGKPSMQDRTSRVRGKKAVECGGCCAKVKAVAMGSFPSPERRINALRVLTHCFAVCAALKRPRWCAGKVCEFNGRAIVRQRDCACGVEEGGRQGEIGPRRAVDGGRGQ